MSKVAELEQKLEERRAARAKLEEEQYEKDLEARLELEDEHGAIAAVKVARFVPGHPTRAYVRTPTSAQYKRLVDLVHRSAATKNPKGGRDASDQIARSCWVYPREEKDREAMLEAFPGLLTQISLAAVGLAEGKAEEEGKD